MRATKDPAEQWRNKVNHAQGAFFEQRIEASFAIALLGGYANIRKNHEPMKPIKDMGGGRFVAVYTKKSDIDYRGELRGGGSAAFEAKYTVTDRIEQDRVTEEQTKTMDEHERFGAQCFVLCGYKSGRVYKVPWRVWKDMKNQFGRKYVTENDLNPWICPVKSNGLPEIIKEIDGMTERPAKKDTLAIADLMAQLVRLVAFANGMDKNKTYSLSYNCAMWFELSCFDQMSGKKTFIADMDTTITIDNLKLAVDNMMDIVGSCGNE